jgi:arylsulfatase A-like enzyme
LDFPFDHHLLSLFCLPEHEDDDNPFSFMKGAWSKSRRCLYHKDAHTIQLEHAEQFWSAYPTEPKLLNLDFMDAHEPTGQNVATLDDPISEFLNHLLEKGALEDTHIVIWSDHGHHHHPMALFNASDYYIETFLPAFFYIMP